MAKDTTIVVGLDGATWRLLDRWIKEEELPNIASIKNNSATGTLESCLPPVTCPNWKCYSTGKNPGKLGVFWWEMMDLENREIELPDSTSFRSPEIWDYLSDNGLRVGVINMPLGFPPHKVNGFMIARNASNDQEYTYPEDLKATLQDQFGYKVNTESNIGESNYTDDILELIDIRFQVLKWALETKDLDFVHITVFLINTLQHYFWDEESTLKGWKLIDEHLDDIVTENRNIIFMSDHGSNEIKTTFQANAWLEDEGYLKREETVTNTVNSIGSRFGFTQRSLSSITEKIGVRHLLRKAFPDSIIDLLPEEGVSKQRKLDLVDMDRTEAIASGQGLIYLTDPSDDDFRDELMSKLESLSVPETGASIASKVYKKEDVYHGPYLSRAPDIVFDQAPGIHTDELVGDRDVFEAPRKWRGENEREGIFIAHGPAFNNDDLGRVSIMDIMPTLLHQIGEPIPNDIDGSVLDVFDEESPPASRTIEYRDPISKPEERTTVSQGAEERLRELGYFN